MFVHHYLPLMSIKLTKPTNTKQLTKKKKKNTEVSKTFVRQSPALQVPWVTSVTWQGFYSRCGASPISVKIGGWPPKIGELPMKNGGLTESYWVIVFGVSPSKIMGSHVMLRGTSSSDLSAWGTTIFRGIWDETKGYTSDSFVGYVYIYMCINIYIV